MRARQDMPPEVRRMMNELGPQGMLLLGSLFFGGVSLVFGMIGGVLGAVMIKKPSPPPTARAVPPVRGARRRHSRPREARGHRPGRRHHSATSSGRETAGGLMLAQVRAV